MNSLKAKRDYSLKIKKIAAFIANCKLVTKLINKLFLKNLVTKFIKLSPIKLEVLKLKLFYLMKL